MVHTSYNLKGTHICSHANACVCMSHTLLHASPILLLQTYNLIPFSQSSVHAETRGEYSDNNLSSTPRIKWLNNRKNTGLN